MIHQTEANAVLDMRYGSESPASLFLALMTEKPGFAATGASLVEPTAVDYARLEVPNNATMFPAASNGSKTNGELLLFPAATNQWGTIRYWALTNASTDGDLLVSGQTSQRFVQTGKAVLFLTGTLTIKVR